MLQNEFVVKVKPGWIKLPYSALGVKEISFPVKSKPVIVSQNPPLFMKKLGKELKAYFCGKKQGFSPPFDFKCFTLFQTKVWKSTKRRDPGRLLRRKELEEKIVASGTSKMTEKSTATGLIILVSIAVIVLFYFAPGEGGIYPPCPTHYLTNFSCPGCGSLRALHNLLHGNIKEAFFFNPLMVMVLPFLTVWFLLYVLKSIFAVKLPEVKLKPAIWWLIISCIILFMILRNLSFYPFTLFKS